MKEKEFEIRAIRFFSIYTATIFGAFIRSYLAEPTTLSLICFVLSVIIFEALEKAEKGA